MNVPLRLGLMLAFCMHIASAAMSPQQIFNEVRARVSLQLKKTANYTCVETLDRNIYLNYYDQRTKKTCDNTPNWEVPKLFSHDRLRLDVAVSEGSEIYSWHGVKTFSSKGVTDVVHSGPISSGSFVGYLENIFFRAGVKIHYLVMRDPDGRYHFTYDVPLSASAHYVLTGSKGELTAFHGEFSADPHAFELTSLTVVIDRPPRQSQLCSASIGVRYQTVDISGTPARVPKGFTIEIKDRNHTYTSSQSTYQACRAFVGESTINFDLAQNQANVDNLRTAPKPMPAGVSLPIALQTPVGDLRSFTGDPVEGIVMRPVSFSKGREIIPAGAHVDGVITRLDNRFEPSLHHFLGIRFDRLTFGNTTFLLEAIPAKEDSTRQQMRYIYSGSRALDISQNAIRSLFVFTGAHFNLDSNSIHDWITVKLSGSESH